MPALSPPWWGRKQIPGLGGAKSLEFAREGSSSHNCNREGIIRQRIQPRLRTFARSMRADSTRAENLLWQALRGSKLEGLKFKRQVPLDGYILDFVSFEERLIVEVDGGQHSESVSDAERDRHFEKQGFRTLRFWNDDVERRIDGVCLMILRAVGRG